MDAELVAVKTLIVTELLPFRKLSRDFVILMNPTGFMDKTTDLFVQM